MYVGVDPGATNSQNPRTCGNKSRGGPVSLVRMASTSRRRSMLLLPPTAPLLRSYGITSAMRLPSILKTILRQRLRKSSFEFKEKARKQPFCRRVIHSVSFKQKPRMSAQTNSQSCTSLYNSHDASAKPQVLFDSADALDDMVYFFRVARNVFHGEFQCI